jgi:hypothetical protein
MKRFFLWLTGSIMLSMSLTNAQQIGLKAGIGSSKLAADWYGLYGSESQGIFSGNLGVVADFPVTGKVRGMPSLELTRRGGKAGGPFTLSYVTLTLPASYEIDLGSGAAFAAAGPYVGYALSANWKYSGYGKLDFEAEGMNRIDVGLSLLTGYKFSLPGVNSSLERPFAAYLQYAFGVTNLGSSSSGYYTFDDYNLRNGGTFAIGAIYYFGEK